MEAALSRIRAEERGADRSEGFRILQAVDDGAKPAHGEAADVGVLPVPGEREGTTGEIHQLFADKGTIHFIGHGVIHRIYFFSRRHHHSQVPVLRPGLYPGAADPIGIIPENTVEQVEVLKGFSSGWGCPGNTILSVGRTT